MNFLTKLYYKITAHLPRLLPRNHGEFEKLRAVMLHAFGCPDRPSTTMVLAGQVTSTEAHKIRKSFAHIANCINRLEINAVAAEFRQKAIQENNERLEAATKKAMDAFKKEEEEAQTNDQTSEIVSEAHGEPQPAQAPKSQPAESTEGHVPTAL